MTLTNPCVVILWRHRRHIQYNMWIVIHWAMQMLHAITLMYLHDLFVYLGTVMFEIVLILKKNEENYIAIHVPSPMNVSWWRVSICEVKTRKCYESVWNTMKPCFWLFEFIGNKTNTHIIMCHAPCLALKPDFQNVAILILIATRHEHHSYIRGKFITRTSENFSNTATVIFIFYQALIMMHYICCRLVVNSTWRFECRRNKYIGIFVCTAWIFINIFSSTRTHGWPKIKSMN